MRLGKCVSVYWFMAFLPSCKLFNTYNHQGRRIIMIDTGYVQTGAVIVDSDHLAPGCGAAETVIDDNINSGICLNPGHVTIDFNPTNTAQINELWIKIYGATGTLAYGYGPLIFSLFNWDTNQFDEVKTYNTAVPEIWHWIEFKVEGQISNFIKPDGTIRLKIFGQYHIGTSARVREVYVRAIYEDAGIALIETMPVNVIDGIGEQYAQQLTNQGIDNVIELYMIQPDTLSPLVDLSIAKLHEFQRKADFAINTKFDRNIFNTVFDWKLKDIIETTDNDIRNQTGMTIQQITELKSGIATLFVALDNSEVNNFPLSYFELL